MAVFERSIVFNCGWLFNAPGRQCRPIPARPPRHPHDPAVTAEEQREKRVMQVLELDHIKDLRRPACRGRPQSDRAGRREWLAIVGSGSGKTTLMNMIGCMGHALQGLRGWSRKLEDLRPVGPTRKNLIGLVLQFYLRQ